MLTSFLTCFNHWQRLRTPHVSVQGPLADAKCMNALCKVMECPKLTCTEGSLVRSHVGKLAGQRWALTRSAVLQAPLIHMLLR